MSNSCTSLDPFDCAVFTILGEHFLYSASAVTYFALTDCARDVLLDKTYLLSRTCSSSVYSTYSMREIELTAKKLEEIRRTGIIVPRAVRTPGDLSYSDYCLKLLPTRRCNLSCAYCFNTTKSPQWDMSVETAKEAIDFFIDHFAAAGSRIIVDFTGAGEPLLRLDFILEVNDYVLQIRERRSINIFSQFATNGMLLKPKISALLKKKMIMYGISIDGDKTASCQARTGLDYDLIVSNIVNMANRQYLGLAATFSARNHDLISIFETLYRLDPEVIGMKPVRLLPNTDGAITMDTVAAIMNSYTEFCVWLLNRVSAGDEKVFSTLMNGEDYFVRFLKIVIRRNKLFYRCSAGLSAIAVDSNGNILICPAFIREESLIIGNIRNGIDPDAQARLRGYYADNIPYCRDCWARYACGGECFAVGYSNNLELTKPVQSMCVLKKHLIMLSVYFWSSLKRQQPSIYQKVLKKYS